MTDITDKSAILRAMLDERGVDHTDGGDASCKLTWWRAGGLRYCYREQAFEDGNVESVLFMDERRGLSPGQAVAATLGSGKLTAEQVMTIAGRHQPDYCSDTHACFDWRAIADELNAALGNGTCEPDEPDGWYKCPDCGCVVGYWQLVDDTWTIYMDDYQIPLNACPNCGKAVER